MLVPKISICIPAYEMGGNGATYLEESFKHLAKQNFREFEVVVSDQSNDDAVKELCKAWENKFEINHLWSREFKRQASANVNRAIDAARGEIVKVLFQDDFLCAPDALSLIYESLTQNDAKWLLVGSGVTKDGQTIERPMVPELTSKLHFGKNTVSSPSVLAMKKECAERFDENLIWLMDVELYKRLWVSHGEPSIVPETLVANRIHAGQVSAGIDRQLQARELDYVWKAFASTTSLSGKAEYARRRLKTILSR